MKHPTSRGTSSTIDRRRLLQIGATGTALAAWPSLTGAQATPAATPTTDLDSLITPIVEASMAATLAPGAVVLWRTPEGEYLRAFGTRVAGEDVPVTTGDHFRVGSNTKPMTGTVLLQLAEEGLLSTDDPVSTYRPDVPNGENITIAQLLEMRSGLFSYTQLLSFNESLDADPQRVWQPEELVAIGLAEPPSFPPGEQFEYSNTNTILAGLIAEDLTGKPLATLFQERLFDPLGLGDITFPALEDATLPDPHANGYMYGTNASTFESEALPEDEQAAAFAGDLLPNDQTAASPSWAWAAGSASSTAPDLATFIEALVGGKLHGAEMQATRLASLQPVSDAPDALAYGMTLAKFGPLLGHTGALPGYQSFMGHDPETGSTMVVLTNLQISPDGHATANEIAIPLIEALYGG
jgi:D-alanyl-D-alanine carboxypeptidase